MSQYHIPVMLKEVTESLQIQPNSWYVDANLGGGGHTSEIIKQGGRVLGIDLDPDAISEVAKKHGLKIETQNDHLLAFSDHLILYQTNFTEIKSVIEELKLGPVSGILFDLGVSTHQLEEAERGFSFNSDAPLDMRMNKSAQTAKAQDLVNGLHENELAKLFWELGEERFSRPIAKRIVQYRAKKLIETTNELASIILSVRHRSPKDRTHPATRIFQALRIAVNDELNSLRDALSPSFEVLSPEGRLVVISFHSLEDRIVKNFFQEKEKLGQAKILTPKPTEPTEQEISGNPRSRSGKLRALEKI